MDCLVERERRLWQGCLRPQKRHRSGSGTWRARRRFKNPLHESRRKPLASGVNDPPNDGAKSLAKRRGIVGRNGPTAGSQSTMVCGPNRGRVKARGRVPKISTSGCRYKEIIRPNLHILSTWCEKATESFHDHCRQLGVDAIDIKRPKRASHSRR